MNLFAGAARSPQGDGDRARDGLRAGDRRPGRQHAAQRDAVDARLLEGGTPLDPNSGSTNPPTRTRCAPELRGYPPSAANLAEAREVHGRAGLRRLRRGRRTRTSTTPTTCGALGGSGWPAYPGLMDRAQLPFTAAGLDVPSYVTNGNHDGLVQGNQDGERGLRGHRDRLLQGARRTSTPLPGQPPDGLDPSVLLTPSGAGCWSRPTRCGGSSTSGRSSRSTARTARTTRTATTSSTRTRTSPPTARASYYAWDPPEAPGIRFISIDTLSEGGIVEQSSNGNIDDPQFQWLERELEFATARDKLIVVFGHHPIRILNSNAPDEAAGPCSGVDAHARRHARARPQPGLRHRPARVGADPLRRAEPAPAGRHRRDAVASCSTASRT